MVQNALSPKRFLPLCAAIVLFLNFLTGCSRYIQYPDFPADSFQERPLNFAGNSFSLSAQIDSQLAWEAGKGRLLVVRDAVHGKLLPVFIPDELQGENFLVGQRYDFVVQVASDGLIKVSNIDKL